MTDLVSVCIINYCGAEHLSRAIDSALNQDYGNIEIIAIDNASTDGSREILNSFEGKIEAVLNDENIGYCSAANIGIRRSSGAYLLFMNPDVFLQPDFITSALKAFSDGGKTAAVSGKLLRFDEELGGMTNTIDSTGLIVNRAYRAFDRGSGQHDRGQYDKKTNIFAVCGAAGLYSRKFLDDIRTESGEYFDEKFFAYKEDVDIAWRGRNRGWRCLFAPGAVAYHVRAFQKEKRAQMPDNVRFHSFKNRHLTLIKNITLPDFIFRAPCIFMYETALLGHVLLRDRKLLDSYRYVFKNFRLAGRNSRREFRNNK